MNRITVKDSIFFRYLSYILFLLFCFFIIDSFFLITKIGEPKIAPSTGSIFLASLCLLFGLGFLILYSQTYSLDEEYFYTRIPLIKELKFKLSEMTNLYINETDFTIANIFFNGKSVPLMITNDDIFNIVNKLYTDNYENMKENTRKKLSNSSITISYALFKKAIFSNNSIILKSFFSNTKHSWNDILKYEINKKTNQYMLLYISSTSKIKINVEYLERYCGLASLIIEKLEDISNIT